MRLVEYTDNVYLDNWQDIVPPSNELDYTLQSHGGFLVADDDNRFVAESASGAAVDISGNEHRSLRAGQGFISQMVSLPLIYGFEGGTTIDLAGSLVNANVHLVDSPEPEKHRNGILEKPRITTWSEADKYSLNVQGTETERFFEAIRSRTEPLTVRVMSGKLNLGDFTTVQGLTT